MCLLGGSDLHVFHCSSLCGGNEPAQSSIDFFFFVLFTPVTQSEASCLIRSVEGKALYYYVTLSISLNQLLDDKADVTDRFSTESHCAGFRTFTKGGT